MSIINSKQDYLSIGAIFRNEDSYLDEWVRYNKLIGVERIYLVAHEPNPVVAKAVLKPYIDEGFVYLYNTTDVFLGDGKYNQWCQRNVQEWLINLTKNKTYWLALIDIDEFILPKLTDDCRVFLQDYEQREFSGIAINWRMFGSNGFITRPQSQINNLLMRDKDGRGYDGFGVVIKSIVKPNYPITLNKPNGQWHKYYATSHYFHPTMGWVILPNGETVSANTVLPSHVQYDKIQINHYHCRSLLDFHRVKLCRTRGHAIKNIDQWWEHHDTNEVFDDEISQRFGKNF